MGSLLSCFSDPEEHKRSRSPPPRRRGGGVGHHPPPPHGGSSNRWSKPRTGRRDDALTQEQAMAAAAAMLLQQNGVNLPFDRSSSVRYSPASGQKKQALPRSSSSRPRSVTDPLLPPQQLINQDLKVDDLETNHFVLVHGGGFGAWCWYKTIAHLEDSGFKVNAIDLTGAGIDSSDTNNITSLTQYVKPLTSFLEKLNDGEKVILVGHDFGGTCISYAMEMFPSKIAKAVFVSAAMLMNGQSTLDMFSQQDMLTTTTQRLLIGVRIEGGHLTSWALEVDFQGTLSTSSHMPITVGNGCPERCASKACLTHVALATQVA